MVKLKLSHNVSFVDMKLPYSQCVPTKQVLCKHDFNGNCFTFSQRAQQIDNILRAPDIRKFQVLDAYVWEKSLPSEPLIEIHPLDIIFKGMKKEEQDGYIYAL